MRNLNVFKKLGFWGAIAASLMLLSCSGSSTDELDDPLDEEQAVESEIDQAIDQMNDSGEDIADDEAETLPGETAEAMEEDAEDISQSAVDSYELEQAENAQLEAEDDEAGLDQVTEEMNEGAAEMAAVQDGDESEDMAEETSPEMVEEELVDEQPVSNDQLLANSEEQHQAGHSSSYESESSSKQGYIVKLGDTLAGIAHEIYGDASRWQELASQNQLTDPNALMPGDVIAFSNTDQTSSYAKKQKNAQIESVVVQAGDTLSSIAGQVLGSTQAWRYLWRYNESMVPNPDVIEVGMRLEYVNFDATGSLAKQMGEEGESTH